MKYFFIFSVFIFLSIVYFLDILQYLVSSEYRSGIMVVPIVLLCFVFQGIYFNLSIWYKLTDRTEWGAYISLIGLFFTVVGNVVFIPIYGYIAAAWVSCICFFVMMIISWFFGQKYYTITYDMKSLARYTIIGILLYFVGMNIPIDSVVLRLGLRSIILLAFLFYVLKTENMMSSLPFFNKTLKKSDIS